MTNLGPEPTLDGFTTQALLCDSAVAVDGKLYLQGAGWNAIAAGGMPFTAPRIGMALLLGVPFGHTMRRHELQVSLIDEDGHELPLGPVVNGRRTARLQVGFEVGRPPHLAPGDTQLLPFALNIDGYQFARPGGYAFLVTVDGSELTRLRFRVHVGARPV